MFVRGTRGAAVDHSDPVVPGSSPLNTGVAVCVSAMAMSYVVLPRTVVDVTVVVVVATVTHTFILLPAAWQ